MSSRHRLMLVAGSGGALLDLLALRPWWSEHDVTWAAVQAADTSVALTGETVHWHSALPPRARLVVSPFLRAVRLLRATRVQLVVFGGGGGVAVPFFLAARVLRRPTIWVEPLTAVGPPCWCARSASTVVVQTQAQLASRPGAVLIGELY